MEKVKFELEIDADEAVTLVALLLKASHGQYWRAARVNTLEYLNYDALLESIAYELKQAILDQCPDVYKKLN